MKLNKTIKFFLLIIIFSIPGNNSFSQEIIQQYDAIKNDSLRIGKEVGDVLPLIQKGYTLMLPNEKEIEGTLIFFEDSGYDKKNKNSKQIYSQASENGFAVLSVSTEIPFDFYFTKESVSAIHGLIEEVFMNHDLPNENIFLLGIGLGGHRALRHIKIMNEENFEFQLNIDGVVICNSILDWNRKWYQYDREIRLNRNDLWEPKFVIYMLETYLNGTPQTNPEDYNDFSSYSYFDQENENTSMYTNYSIRAYIEPAIKYWLTKRLKTMYENNSPDMVGLLAELELAGNKNTELIVLQPEDNPSQRKNPDTTWNAIDKVELMEWILEQVEK